MEFTLLIQFNEDTTSRIAKEFKSIDDIIIFYFKIFEEYYITTPEYSHSENKEVLVVDLKDYLTFLYLLFDFGIIEFNKEKSEYLCYGKEAFSYLFINYIEKCKNEENKHKLDRNF